MKKTPSRPSKTPRISSIESACDAKIAERSD